MREVVWETKEFEEKPKNEVWYACFFGVILICLVFALYQANFLFVILIILGGGLVYLFGHRKPINLECVLNESGIAINGSTSKMYEFEGFHLGHHLLALKTKKGLNNYLLVRVPHDKNAEIRDILKAELPEAHYEPGITELFYHWLHH